MRATLLKLIGGVVAIAVVVGGVILLTSANGEPETPPGGRAKAPNDMRPGETRPVSRSEMEQVALETSLDELIGRLGPPTRIEEGSDPTLPRRKYAYYAVAGEEAREWELVLRDERLQKIRLCREVPTPERAGEGCPAA